MTKTGFRPLTGINFNPQILKQRQQPQSFRPLTGINFNE